MSTKPRTPRLWLACAVTALTMAATTTTIATPAAASVPASWAGEQVTFIASHQLSDGAILSSPTQINPYFANIAAMGLARANTATSRSALTKWISWYLGHLNNPDASGLVDTVYDYQYNASTTVETATNDYDSVDSYASTTLNVAYLAYLTGDTSLRNLVSANIVTYEGIANLLDFGSGSGGVRDTNNLTFAKPSYHADYLMDNAEVYSGLSDFAQLESALGRTSQSTYYASWAATTQSAITSLLWNSTNNNWDWALGSSSTMTTFYPDAVAQLWPIIFGVVGPTSSQAATTWSGFTTHWPNWNNDTINDPSQYPWSAMARAGQLMGASADADTLLTTIRNQYAPGWAAPAVCSVSVCGDWYDAEAGWFALGVLQTGP